jgi:hypothetical protein
MRIPRVIATIATTEPAAGRRGAITGSS